MGKGKISSEVLFWLVYAATKVLKNSSKRKTVFIFVHIVIYYLVNMIMGFGSSFRSPSSMERPSVIRIVPVQPSKI